VARGPGRHRGLVEGEMSAASTLIPVLMCGGRPATPACGPVSRRKHAEAVRAR